MIDFYQTLSVGRCASVQQIEKAYLRIRNCRRPAKSDEDATQYYKAMQAEAANAYLTLSNLASRQRFDAELDYFELATSIGSDFKPPISRIKATNEQVKAIKLLLRARAALRIRGAKI